MFQRITAALIPFFLVFSFLPICALANEESPKGPPSGEVSMTFGRGSFILTAGGGHGTLTFKGGKHKFKILEAGVGGIGAAKVVASGSVYNLEKVEDFPGAYAQLSAGYAAFNTGEGALWLKNSNGVVLKLNARAKGLELTAGGQGLVISMRNNPKK